MSITPAANNTRNVSLQDTNALSLGTITATGTLTAVANGAISDAASNLTIAGTTTLTAGAANSITLDNANDFGGAVRIVSGNDVHAARREALAFSFGGGVRPSQAISPLRSAGAVTQAAGVTVGGTTSINAGAGNDVTLNASNDFGGAVSAAGRNVNLRDTNAMVLGTVTANGAGTSAHPSGGWFGDADGGGDGAAADARRLPVRRARSTWARWRTMSASSTR